MQADRTKTRGLECSARTARAHAPLVQRAGAIILALGGAPTVRLIDSQAGAGEGATDTNGIVLRQIADDTSGAGLVRTGPRAMTLVYRDAGSEAALGALMACIAATASAAPAAPIAADATSLSVLALAERLAMSEIPVLINGPTGTGKEVLSRFIHRSSPRAAGPFVAVNCAAMPETMLEALLFGHQKGAFTGATQASEGFFRAADGGTLLLDEIAEMPLALQAKLLRALQEGEVVPIGATQAIPVDVRVLAAANRDLPTEVAQGRFRADLYYRLNVFPLALHPLQDRPDDIAPLAFAMLLRHAPAFRVGTAGSGTAGSGGGQMVPWITEPALALLRQHSWPGNVRELENVMRRALLLCGADEIGPEHIQFDRPARLVTPTGQTGTGPTDTGPTDTGSTETGRTETGREPFTRRRLANIVQRSEAEAIVDTLQACGGSRIAAARQLGISERTLRYRLAAFRDAGIDVGQRSSEWRRVGAR